jgi:hypothetical protein
VWTDFYLPLSVSVPAEITRVMVGRIELVTREQRDHLQQLGQISTSTITNEAVRLHTDFYGRITTNPKELNRVDEGRQSLKAFGISVPKSYQLYLSLGRFRNALILEEARKRPSQGLDGFISTYRLEGYKPVDIAGVDDSQRE